MGHVNPGRANLVVVDYSRQTNDEEGVVVRGWRCVGFLGSQKRKNTKIARTQVCEK